MDFVIECVKFGLCAAFVMWVLDFVIADAVAKGIAKSTFKNVQIDLQQQIEEGVSDALETYFRKRSIKDIVEEDYSQPHE
ncbi:MAG TPA: hypothetical protein VJW94_03655 [Candidatus Acidoferrum sp.]|nr:hypothetical protein [Candidatus Acidoferrum sp.]